MRCANRRINNLWQATHERVALTFFAPRLLLTPLNDFKVTGTMVSIMRYSITQATLNDQDALALMFNAYRIFYGKPPDVNIACVFLRERLVNRESVIFLARDPETHSALGFVQLYPSFSSVSAGRTWILNDLFVEERVRRRGVGHALLEAARSHARDTGALYLSLSTAHDNLEAQRLYESLGYVRDSEMFNYSLMIN